jgi:transposase-like protein
MKTAERNEARRLRQERGLSVKELARFLGVSKSSVSRWVRDIELTQAQSERLRQRMGHATAPGSSANAKKGLARRREAQAAGTKLARRGDLLHACGCMLFWAEGSRSRNTIEFVNSDPAMLSFFVRFLRTCLEVPDTRIRIKCNLFVDHLERQHEVEQFWLDLLELPPACLHKSAVNAYSKYSLEEAAQQAAVRHVLPQGERHASCPGPLRCDPRVRRVRSRGVGHVGR